MATPQNEKAAALIAPEHEEDHRAPGTMVLVLILLVSFAIYYFANWLALADVWHVR